MTPKHIANQLALIALADMQNTEQAQAAVAMLQRLIPHLRDQLFGQFEVAGMEQAAIVEAYTDILHATMFPDDTDDTEASDEDIMDDGVMDEEELDPDDEPLVEDASANTDVFAGLAHLKELAMGQVIRDKGKFIPLDDIEMPDADAPETADESDENEDEARELAAKPRRRNVMGHVAGGQE